MKKFSADAIKKILISKLTQLGFTDFTEPRLGEFLMRRSSHNAHFSSIRHLGVVQIVLVGGYVNLLAKEMIDKTRGVLNKPAPQWDTNIASFLGENLGAFENGAFAPGVFEAHFQGWLDVCAAEKSNTFRVVLPNDVAGTLAKLNDAFSLFPKIFSDVLPRLDLDLPFKDVPRYLFTHTCLPTLVACFARSVELGKAKEQFELLAQSVHERSAGHFPEWEAILPVLKKYV